MVDLHHNVPINAAPGKVFTAIATQEGMRGWWMRDTTLDSKVGGKAEFGFNKRGTVFRMFLSSFQAVIFVAARLPSTAPAPCEN